MKSSREINNDNIEKWIKSLSDAKVPVKRKRKTPTTTKEPKVFGVQPENVPANQLNLF